MYGATAIAAAESMPGRRAAPSKFERESDLIYRYCRDGDREAREALIRQFMPLARDLARRYAYTGESLEDLVQVAYLGLVKAVDRFEPDRGVRFTSFAVPTILGELKRHLRDRGWAVHLPRGLQESVLALNRATEKVTKKLGRSPSTREIAAELGWSVESVLEALEATNAYEATSLDACVGNENGRPTDTVIDTIGADDDGYERIAAHDLVTSALGRLPAQEREAVELRFGTGLTQREIGERIGVSQMQVSRLLRRALERVKQAM
jgi:RNA polymerase sigma-B factor